MARAYKTAIAAESIKVIEATAGTYQLCSESVELKLTVDSEGTIEKAEAAGEPTTVETSDAGFAMQFMQAGSEEMLLEQKPVSRELLETLISGETVLAIPN